MEFVIEAMGQPASTLALVSGLCTLSVFVIVHTLGNQILGALLYPFSIFASLCVSKFFIDHHFYSHRAFDKWVLFTIISVGIGMALTLLGYIAISRIMSLFRVSRKPIELNDLRVSRIQLDVSRGN